MTTRGVLSHTVIHSSIDGRHGVLEARHIAEALQIPYEPEDPFAFRQWSPVSQRDMRAYYFGPHHLIMASLIHFEEKPWLERRRLCRERFTLDKWNQLVGYSAPLGAPPMVAPPVPPQPEHGELPAQTVPPIPTPEATFVAPPTTPTVPPVAPTTSEPTITILALEFCTLCIPFRHSPPPILLSSNRWLRYVPIRTSKLLFFARFSSTSESYLCLSLTFPHPQSYTTPAEVRIAPPQDEPPIVTAS
ncbi:hypothetical protein CK203_061167 [Vitis vinifera]|uniref:Uncharacterized protein n=1 Tax=Vitis vinifera TaxID=29760 RepID=A0A438GCB3_VITVI|nr:hypothetical protein CK203_061167 [Vitis vinifera]